MRKLSAHRAKTRGAEALRKVGGRMSEARAEAVFAFGRVARGISKERHVRAGMCGPGGEGMCTYVHVERHPNCTHIQTVVRTYIRSLPRAS